MLKCKKKKCCISSFKWSVVSSCERKWTFHECINEILTLAGHTWSNTILEAHFMAFYSSFVVLWILFHVSMSVCSLHCFLFPSTTLSFFALFLSSIHAPPLFMWHWNSCLVRGVRLARQAGCRLCRAWTLSSLYRTRTLWHRHTFFSYMLRSHTVTSIHIHLNGDRKEWAAGPTFAGFPLSYINVSYDIWIKKLNEKGKCWKHSLNHFPRKTPFIPLLSLY